MMNHRLLFVLSSCMLLTQQVKSFSLSAIPQASRTSSSALGSSVDNKYGGVDVESLLKKAAELKAQAAQAEENLHQEKLEKKQYKDSDSDKCIDRLFLVGEDNEDMEGIVKRLKDSHWSTDRLLMIVERLHEREIAAQGKSRVEASVHHGHTKFETVGTKDEKELARVTGLIDKLIQAAEIIDEEYMSIKRKSKESKYLNHVDLDHWTVGEVSSHLRNKVKELRREHDKQFQERLESFYEAQRRKDIPKPGEEGKKKKQ